MKANELKEKLEKTLDGLLDNTIMPDKANAIASQAREYLRTQKEQREIFNQAGLKLSNGFIEWAK